MSLPSQTAAFFISPIAESISVIATSSWPLTGGISRPVLEHPAGGAQIG
jgi:hypothetical protein